MCSTKVTDMQVEEPARPACRKARPLEQISATESLGTKRYISTMAVFEEAEIHTLREVLELDRDAQLKETDDHQLPNLFSEIEISVTTIAGTRETQNVAVTEKRGMLARFALLEEMKDPRRYSERSKWVITTLVAIAAVGGPMGTSILYPSLSSIATSLATSPEIVNLSVAFYCLALGVFPLWWASTSEMIGRRTIYIISFTLYTLFSALSAVSSSIGIFIAMRLLSGACSASVQAVGAGTVTDIWEPKERGKAMGIFYLGPICGPMLSPIIGGALSTRWGWRSSLWFCAAFAAFSVVTIVLFLPETLPRESQVVSTSTEGNTLVQATTNQTALKISSLGKGRLIWHFIIIPIQYLTYLRFLPVFLMVLYASITLGAIYVVNISIQLAYAANPYDFSMTIIGVLYLPLSIGDIISSTLGGRWIDYIMVREAKKAERYNRDGTLCYLPEDRMRENIWVAATLYPVSMILFGWTLERGIFWFIPAFASCLFGLGTMLVFGAVTTMLTEFMPKQPSASIAINNFSRGIFACIGTVFTQPLAKVLGFGWMCTITALIAWAVGIVSICILRYHIKVWREKITNRERSFS
ncbi:multidrug transporter of the major facilitator superfamily [Trichoderma ceciliae]